MLPAVVRTKKPDSAFGARLRARLHALGHSQTWLSEATGLRREKINLAMKTSRLPSGDDLTRYAAALRCSVDDLAGTDTESTGSPLPKGLQERMTFPVIAELLNQLGIPQGGLSMKPITEEELLDVLQRRKEERQRLARLKARGEPKARGHLQRSRKK